MNHDFNNFNFDDLYFLNSLNDSDILEIDKKSQISLESNTVECTPPNFVSEFNISQLENLLPNNKNKKEKGRKRKEDKIQGKHNKFSKDLTLVKIKTLIINKLHEFINRKIEIILGKDVRKGLVKKTLMKLNRK